MAWLRRIGIAAKDKKAPSSTEASHQKQQSGRSSGESFDEVDVIYPRASHNKTIPPAKLPRKKGNQPDRPLVNGSPFWYNKKGVGGDDDEEDTEVEDTIDLDFIKSVLDNSVQLRPNPIPKNVNLDPLGSISAIKQFCAHYNEDNVIQATVLNAVMEATPEDIANTNKKPPLKILWDRKVKMVELDIATRNIVGRSERPFIMSMSDGVAVKNLANV